MSRILRLVACLALLTGSLFVAVPVSAHDPHGVGPCETASLPFPVNKATGHSSSSPTYDRYGVKAVVDPATADQFQTCGPGSGAQSDHSSLWIGITERGASSARIIQIGVLQCNWSGAAVCSGSTPHYFYAAAGCGSSLPNAIDLGVAGTGSHWMQISHSSQNNNWYMWIDKNQDNDFSDLNELVVTIDDQDPRTVCWLNAADQRAVLYYGERGDNGDGLGEYANASWISQTQHQRTIAGSFVSDYWNTQQPYQPCGRSDDGLVDGYSYCQLGGAVFADGQYHAPSVSDSIKMWTDFDGGNYPYAN